MRILHVTESYGGGVATAIQQYRDYPADQLLLGRLRSDVDESSLPQGSADRLVARRLDLLREWHRMRSVRVDVVHAHSSIAGAMTRVLPHHNAPVVYSPHGLAIDHRRVWVRSGASVIEHWLAARTVVFAAVSGIEAETLERLSNGLRPVMLVPHHVPVADAPVPRQQRLARVIAVGRLTYAKNPESVADLAQRVDPSGSIVEFLWVGDGDQGRRRLMERHGWRVTGWLPRSEVLDLVARSSVLVHPSRHESMPFAVVEAMSLGTPAVTAARAYAVGLPVVAALDHPHELATIINRLLCDGTAWAEASEAGLRHVRETFSADAQRLALDRVYHAAHVV